ncbi:MAG: hypothetical protein K2Z81_00845 [Cyanobacteria bacterium]|nr:hypothetical protein [Cyanobacteriota bacterium]
MSKEQIEIEANVLVDLAIYAWRLDAWLSQQNDMQSGTVPRYVVRGLNRLLEQCNVSTLDATGNDFDAGLAFDVVDSIEMDNLPPGASIIGETVSPIVTINGNLARHGQIVLHVGEERGAAENV